MKMPDAMIKKLIIPKLKNTAPLFLFLEGQMHLCPSLYFHFSCYGFIETIFNMKLYTLDTKYTDILIVNVSFILSDT